MKCEVRVLVQALEACAKCEVCVPISAFKVGTKCARPILIVDGFLLDAPQSSSSIDDSTSSVGEDLECTPREAYGSVYPPRPNDSCVDFKMGGCGCRTG